MGAAVISKVSLFPSLLSPIPIRHKSYYKFMCQLRDRVPTPHYTNPSQYNKYDDENHRGGGGTSDVASIIGIGEEYTSSPL